MNPDAMARGLGMFSIGLGMLEILGANSLAKSLGMKGREGLLQLFGAREIATGIACLGMNPPTAGVWSRVAGDALDIATLVPYLTPENPKRENVGIALAAVAGVTVADIVTGMWLCEGRDGAITQMVRRPMEQLEQESEQEMREAEARGEDYASSLSAT